MATKLSPREKERRRRERWERNFVFKPPKSVQAKPRTRLRLPPAHWLRPLADAGDDQQLRAWLEARRRHGYLPPITHPDADWATQ
jgi:hypothetical protein